MHALAAAVSTPWGWFQNLSNAQKAWTALAGAVSFGILVGGAGMRFGLDRERFTAGAATAAINAAALARDSARLEDHVRITEQIRAEGFRRIESLEASFDLLRVVRDRQRADSARLYRIECYVEAIVAQSGTPALTRCGIQGRQP